jgi:hypothetical protein
LFGRNAISEGRGIAGGPKDQPAAIPDENIGFIGIPDRNICFEEVDQLFSMARSYEGGELPEEVPLARGLRIISRE